MATWFIFFIFLLGRYAINILVFDTSSNTKIAYKHVETSTPLPPIFTLCASFKQNMVEETSFFTLFGESSKPWMTLSLWSTETSNDIRMWLRVNIKWYQIGVIPLHWLNFWIHVCFHADTISGKISFSLNGEPSSSFKAPELIQEVPNNLKDKLYVGLSRISGEKEPTQFHGQISNFNIFAEVQIIEIMSGNPCKYNGDVLNWNDVLGQDGQVEVKNEKAWKICNNDESYTVAISERISWSDAESLCRKLGGGGITEARNNENIDHIVSLFSKVNSTCEYVWTPLVDKELEGVFKSSITGDIATYLPWREGKPDGGEGENVVAIMVNSKLYEDMGERRPFCTPCDVPKTTEFSLIGVCKDSYLGELPILLNH